MRARAAALNADAKRLLATKAATGDPKGDGPRGWPGWDRDLALIALYTARIKRAFSAAIATARDLIAQWRAGTLTVTVAGLVDLIREAVQAALGKILPQAWTEGYALGDASATAVLHAGPPDWGDWEPGDHEAAALVADEQGLRDLLERYGVRDIRAIADTRMDDLAQAISEAARTGASVDDLARRLPEMLDVASRAEMIAHTEIARAVSTAARTATPTPGCPAWNGSSPPTIRLCPLHGERRRGPASARRDLGRHRDARSPRPSPLPVRRDTGLHR